MYHCWKTSKRSRHGSHIHKIKSLLAFRGTNQQTRPHWQEKTNLRNLTDEKLENAPFPLIVMDLSFISLVKVLNRAWSFLAIGGHLITLVKPQFESTKREADQGRGIIRDESIHKRVLNEITKFANENLDNSELFAQTESSPRGTDGNIEFFLGWNKTG